MTIILILSYIAYPGIPFEYNAIEFSTNKKEPTVYIPDPKYWSDNEAAPANGGFVNKANWCLSVALLLIHHRFHCFVITFIITVSLLPIHN